MKDTHLDTSVAFRELFVRRHIGEELGKVLDLRHQRFGDLAESGQELGGWVAV